MSFIDTYRDADDKTRETIRQMVDKIIFECESLRREFDIEDGYCACGGTKLENSDVCRDCL